MDELTHVDKKGQVKMIDVSDKDITQRTAKATSFVKMNKATLDLIKSNGHKKGDVLACARIAGIMAAKQTHNLIPMCHPLLLTSIKVDFEIDAKNVGVKILTICKLKGQTGVEMEALTAASVAALTIYDMCKAVDKTMIITATKLLEKKGGKSGHFIAK